MIVQHKVVGYDKATERVSIEHVIPKNKSKRVRALARLNDGDDATGCYPLDETAAVSIGFSIGQTLNAHLYDWFLEPTPVSADA